MGIFIDMFNRAAGLVPFKHPGQPCTYITKLFEGGIR